MRLVVAIHFDLFDSLLACAIFSQQKKLNNQGRHGGFPVLLGILVVVSIHVLDLYLGYRGRVTYS